MNQVGLIVIAVAFIVFFWALYLAFTIPRFKRPEITWAEVHPLAESNHYFIWGAPGCLTEAGQRRLKLAVLNLLGVFVMLGVVATARYVIGHAL